MELAAKGVHKDLSELEAEIRARDEHNANRSLAPMRPAEDAITLDTSAMSITEQIDFIVSQVEKQQHKRRKPE
jgi:cytidylate kinase